MCIEGNALAYYTKENKKEKMGQIPLRGAVIHPSDYKDKKFCAKIETPHRDYYIVFPTDQEMKEWITCIDHITKPQKTPEPVTNSNIVHDIVVPVPPDVDKKCKSLGIEDFELLKVIGRGNFGRVLLVRKIDSRKLYAMKVLHKSFVVARGEVEHTRSEKKILMNLRHPFLVQLHFSFQNQDRLYLVMDYVNGGELFFHLQQERRFSEERVRFYSAELVTAIEYLHDHGIIYRDLKPENILLTEEGHIRMTDFGLSKEGLYNMDDRTDTFCGTPEYLSPEILEGKPYNKAVDWWSFGTLIYEMLVGLPPFYCEDVQLMYSKIINAPLIIPDYVSPSAADIITRFLERDMERRLQEPWEIKAQPFFEEIDWNELVEMRITPPWTPTATSYDPIFEPEFRNEDVERSDDGNQNPNCILFEGFTYTGGS